MSQSALYWDATYEIVLALMDAHPEFDVDRVGMQELFQMIIQLPNFADDPDLANEGILRAILREWYEESTI